MPGVALNLVLPTLADTFSDIVAQLVTAVEAIEADLEPRITAGELNIDTELSVGGAPVTNVGGLRLTGGETAVAGSVYIDDDDEFHLVTTAGDIQLTLNGGINVTALGSIGGDYGGVNPAAVTYDDASGEYRFTEDTGDWAILAAESIRLHGTLGAILIKVNAAATGYTLTLPPAPASTLALQMSSAGLVSTSNAFTGAVSSTSTVTGTDMRYTGYQLVMGPAACAHSESATDGSDVSAWVLRDFGWQPANSQAGNLIYPLVVRQGETIGSWTVRASKVTNAGISMSVGLYKINVVTRAATLIGSVCSTSANAPGNITFTPIVDPNEAVDDAYTYVLAAFSSSTISGDQFGDYSYTVKRA